VHSLAGQVEVLHAGHVLPVLQLQLAPYTTQPIFIKLENVQKKRKKIIVMYTLECSDVVCFQENGRFFIKYGCKKFFFAFFVKKNIVFQYYMPFFPNFVSKFQKSAKKTPKNVFEKIQNGHFKGTVSRV